MDLRLGFLQLGETDRSTVSLRAGRQDLIFGEQRLLGNFNWINVGRSFDAVRLTIQHSGYRVDVLVLPDYFQGKLNDPGPRRQRLLQPPAAARRSVGFENLGVS